MKILIIGKYPPIQGGVSKSTYILAHELAEIGGHEVFVITNAFETDIYNKQLLIADDFLLLEKNYNSGGYVKLVSTFDTANTYHIPDSPAFYSKLFGAAKETIKEFPPQLIYAHYFEPYCLVATQIGKFYNIPVIIRHAGSDIERLASHKYLKSTYNWIVENCSLILASSDNDTRKKLIDLGAMPNQMANLPKENIWMDSWLNDNVKFDIQEYLPSLKIWYKYYELRNDLYDALCCRTKKINLAYPILGVYGKIDEFKGSFDLINSLIELKKLNFNFNFITITSGSREKLSLYYQRILENEKLQEVSYILPAVAPWKIQSFIDKCDIIFCLERNFPVKIHATSILFEVLSRGKCLVISKDIVNKQALANLFIHDFNVIIVDEPENTTDLTKCISSLIMNPEKIIEIGKNGLRLWENINKNHSKKYTFTNMVNKVMQNI